MKRFFSTLKQQGGFTLIELMVVVAIIGLLSAVAIPNFKKYQAKSKVVEAKLQLSALYTAEAAFFSDYNLYAGCLQYAGYDPENEKASRYYATGFPASISAISATAHLSAVNSGMSTTACPAAAAATGRAYTAPTAPSGTSYYLAGKGIGAVIISTQALFTTQTFGVSAVGSQADTANMTFTALAVGIISGDAATAATGSVLTINERKIISNPQNGY